MNLDDVNPAAPEWRELKTLFRAYFHEDFVEEYGDMRGTLDTFRAQSSADQRQEAVTEIDRLLHGFPDEKSLSEAVRRIGPAYWPPGVGRTYRDWLDEVRTILTTEH